MPTLPATALTLVDSGRGILAADESIRTMTQRLEGEAIAGTEENRRRYRELLVTTPGLAETVSGVILCDETLHQATVPDGTPIPAECRRRGILPGIKVDTGISALAFGHGATVTEGLDGLRGRLERYAAIGAAFAKWRAVIDVTTATDYALRVNAHALARYAALCQEQDLVPIVEPEVLCAGAHSLERCAEVTDRALAVVFEELDAQCVEPQGIVLKPNLVTPGLTGPAASAAEVAEATLDVLRRRVPSTVPGIAFLSGGHSNEVACTYLAELNRLAGTDAPWRLTYSFGRALVSDALHEWGGSEDSVGAAQEVLLRNCARAAHAVQGVAPEPSAA